MFFIDDLVFFICFGEKHVFDMIKSRCLFTSLVQRLIIPPTKEHLKVQNAPINAPLSELQMQILKIIENDPWAPYENIATTLQKNRSTIKRNIQQLKSLGLLQRSGSRKKGSWIIVK